MQVYTGVFSFNAGSIEEGGRLGSAQSGPVETTQVLNGTFCWEDNQVVPRWYSTAAGGEQGECWWCMRQMRGIFCRQPRAGFCE